MSGGSRGGSGGASGNLGRLVIGTRGSALARWQADHVADALRAAHPDLVVEQSIIITEGDRRPTGLVADAGGKAVWVEEIERALLDRRVDLAVHSCKDVPAALAAGLILCAVPPRADARDALVARAGESLAGLRAGARVGTSSLRRACQLRAARPDLAVEILRGNVDTRLRKVADGVVDAAVLASAGLDRLGHADRITERFSTDLMLPAIGQGALALECRGDDERTRRLCAPLGDREAGIAIAAERALLAGLGAGCRTPVAGHARVEDGPGGNGQGNGQPRQVVLRGLVGSPDGQEIVRDVVAAPVDDAAAAGALLARRLLAAGADRLLAL